MTLYELMCRLQEQFDLPQEYNIILYTRERKEDLNERNNELEVNDIQETKKWNDIPIAIQVISYYFIVVIFYINFIIFRPFLKSILHFQKQTHQLKLCLI